MKLIIPQRDSHVFPESEHAWYCYNAFSFMDWLIISTISMIKVPNQVPGGYPPIAKQTMDTGRRCCYYIT